MDAASAVVTVPASSATVSATTTPTSSNAINVNQSNNHIHTHTNTHSGANSLSATTNSSNSSSNNSNISIGGNSSNSNSSCSSSSTSSNSSGYGSTTTTPTNNYDLQQQTTPTTTPIPTTPVAIAEPIIPVATVAAVTPYYNESITTHNLETHQLQHHPPHHTQQQQLQQHQHQHQLLQPNHHLQLPQNHLQANLQPQQHQYLPRQQYYSTYDYQQPAPTHNLSGSSALTAAAAYNVGVTGPYELSSPAYGSGQYKSSSLSGAINYERAGIRTNTAATSYNHQQQQQTEQQQSKTINQQTQQFPAVLASSKQRSSSLIGNSTSTNTSKPQAAATPFYAQPLASQSHSNPTPFYDNTKYKMPLEYHDSYGNPSAAAAASYHQHQKYYAAAKSQLKEAAYGAAAGLNSKSVYPNTANFFPGPAANHGLPATSYDKYMYPHASATGYSSTGHMGNETPPEVSSYRKPVVANSMNSPSWPWGIDYASGNSRTIPPPPASHLPTATVAPTHATYLQPNPTALTRDPYYMAHDKYAVKYDKYAAPSYQQSYVSPPSSRHHLWPSTAHASNLTQLNERHMLASGPTAPPSHGLHTTPYFPNNSTAGLNSRQSCCSQPYQPQSCYYPSSHAIPPRLPHNQSNSVAAPSSGYLTSQQTLGQSPHLNALTASCKYGGVIPDYGNGNKIKNSNDLYLNAHHYDNNTSPHTYGYGSAHSSQQLYASNAHQSMAHGLTPSSLLTHDPLNANQASYTNDLSLTTSNFDNYHTHLDPHLSPQTLAGIHGQQPPPAYGPTVAKRALLDYRKPIQPQPPPTIAEECYTTLSSRDHYNQQELLNTPETTTTFAEYEAQQNNASSLSSYSHTPEALADAEKANDEGNKNLSLRDFIANWNDDEDEFQNNEELNFDQANVIDEVLQTAPVEQAAAAAAAVEDSEMIKTSSLDSKNNEHSLLKSHKIVENLDAQTLSDQYVNLPDIVIDIEKSNNVNNSITTPTTSPTPNTQQEANNFPPNLNNFDVEKELDELKLKKPTQQELTKDLNDINDTKSVTTPQLSPCKNLTTQLSFEDLNLEPANKTVLNATVPTTTTGLTNQQSSELTETYFKDMEGYESGSSRHSNESAFEKEYETFINKITSNASVNKNTEEKSNEADKEMDFEQNVQDFSKFYKRKRKLKEDELKTSVPETPGHKKLKTNVATKVYNSNFPQVYTKKSRNRLNKAKQQTPHKRKPLSVYYKVIHSIRRFGLHRLKRVKEYMTELKDKHLPLIKRQSIKNYTHDLPDNLFNAKSLKALCIMAINTEEFRQRLMLSIENQESCLQAEEKHICTDPTCETCEVIKSLMEAESFEESLLQQVCENNTETLDISSVILCDEGKTETITIVDNAEIISFLKEESRMISNEIENVQYSKDNLTEFETELLVSPNDTNINKSETEFDLNNCYEKSKSPEQDLQTKEYSEIPLQRESAIDNCNTETSLTQQVKEAKDDLETERSNCGDFNQVNQTESVDAKLVSQTILCDDENSNISTASKDIKEPEIPTTAEFNESSSTTMKTEKIEAEKFSQTKNQESESEDSESSESDSDSSSSSSDDESFDDSKDSHKKSDSNDKSSDTDSESDLENDNEKVNSDSNQSYHSVNNKREQNIASKVHKEVVKPFDLTKSENMEQSSDSKCNEINEPKKASLKFNPVNKNRDVNTDSDTEDEIIPKSPQHIVIRIKKSFKLSPNKNSSREVYVSENSLKSYGKFDNQSETESEYDDISEKECEVISKTLKLSPKQNKSLDDNVSENSLSSESELENQTESESEDDDIIKKKVKLSPKLEEELPKEDVIEPDNELDNHRETESEDDEISKKKIKLSPKQEALATEQLMEPHTELEGESKGEDISEKESKIVSTSLQLSPKQEDSLEDHVAKTPIESNTELDNHTESESEDGDTAAKETEIVSESLEWSSKLKDSIESLATDKPIEPQTEFDNHTESECEDDDNLDKESEMITEKENSIEDHATEKPHTESDNESESDEDDISENEMVSKNIKLSTKKKDSIEDHATEKPIEPHTESDNHTESESDEDDISENEMVSKPLKLSTKQEDTIEDHATEKPIEPHTESDNHSESESDEDDISEKECKTPLNLSPKNKDSIKDDVSEKSFESHTEFDKQSESADDEISEKESKVITISLTQKHDNSIEENAEPTTESDHGDDEILQRNCEINVTSLKLSPIQDDNAEFDDQIEQESEVDDKKDKVTELISNSLKFTPKQGDCTDQTTSPKSELESHTENPTNDDFEKESGILTTTSDLSPKAQNSIDECTPEKSADLSHETEVFAIEKPAEFLTELDKHTESKSEDDIVDYISKDKSNFLELSQKADDVKIDEFSKKSTQECIEVNDLIESQSEDDDTDDEEDLPLELSDIKVQHKDSDHTIILSDSDSSSYSESESDNEDEDVAMKSIKTLNDSIPIMISDDESMDNSFDNEDSQKSTNISEDSLNEIKSDAELTESNDSEKSLIDGDNNDLLRNSQERIMNEDSNFPSNKLDPEIPEPAKTTEETMPANEDISPPDSKIVEDHAVSNNVIKSAEEFSSNINSPKEDLPLDCVQINQTQTINDENSCEKCISEYSSSSEDSDEKMDDKLSTKDDQGIDHRDIEDQESIHSENNYSECEENAAVAQESNIPDAVLETNLSKINQNSPKLSGCESETFISSIHSPDEDKLLQKSEELNEDSNSLEAKSKIPQNFSEQTNQNEAVIALSETVQEETCEHLEILADVTVKNFTTEAANIPDNLENALPETIHEETQEYLTDVTVENFVTEPAKISDNLENEDQNKIKEDSSFINENATIPEETNRQVCADHEEHFKREETNVQTANTNDTNILEDVNSPTSESSKETPDFEKRQEHFERENTIAKTTNTDDSNIPEDVNSSTSESFKETPDPEESQTNSKAITEELIVLDKIPAETKETNADSMVKDIDSETITEESNFVKSLNDTSETFDEISCENPSIDDPPTEDCENISETKTSESKESDNETIAESITEKAETADLSVDINKEPLETLKEIYYKEDTNTEFVTETSAIISQIVTEESEYLEKVNSEEVCNPKDITSGNTNEESAITEESNNRLSPDSLKISDKIISDIGTEVLDIIPQEIPQDTDMLDNNQTLELSENTTEHCTNLVENVINESETLEKSCDDEVILWKEALQTVEQISARKEVESPVTVSESKPETLELAEEPNTKSSEVFEEDCDQANESLDNVEDTDIFKEVMQEDLGSSQETFDEKESNNESLIKNSAADPVNDISEILEHEKDHTISEPKPETLELAEEPNSQSSEVFEEECEQANESLDNLEDTDIFKEVMQEDFGKSNETFDEKESSNESLTKDSATVSVADVSEILEQEKDHTTSEPKPETSDLAEEPNTQSSEVFKEECEQATDTESLDNVEDTDIFKEVMQEDLGSSQETLDETLTKDSTTVSVADVAEILEQAEDSMTNNEAIVEKAESLEETINKSSEIVKGFETSCEKVIEKPNTLIEDVNENSECIEQVSIPMNERLSESNALVEVPNKCIQDKNDDSEPEAEEPNKTIEAQYETTECCKDSGAVHGYLSKSEEEKEDKQEASECYEEESDPSHERLSRSEAVVEKPNSLVEDKIENSACYEEDHSLSKLAKPSTLIADNNVTFESYEDSLETHSKDDELVALKSQTDAKPLAEHQAENPECSFKESLGENVDSVFPEENESIEGTALPKDDELVAEKLQAEEPLSAAHQIGDLEPSLNEILTENVSNKDSNTQEDLSGDFLGFKNQSSFEDESEDFHGFEDLEEVARIRQEIENINDDSTANDGFRNYANLNRDLHKSSTTSLTGSTASEINELEALEKELSQHQTEMEEEDEDEDKETDNELQTQTVKIVSTNDIEHIKQMLESDEELQQDEIEIMADADNSKDKFVENSKHNSNDILSSVNSIIPKLSDLCRAALNSSLNSNSNLAQHTETPTILVERELSVEEALAEMYRQAGVLLSDPEDCDNDIATDGGVEEAHDVLLINLQEILNSDNNEVYVLQCDMNENLLNVVQHTAEEQRHEHQDSDVVDDTERVNTVQFIGILDTQSTEPQIHIISSDSESEVIILSDDESDFGYRPFIARQERITIPFINDNDINDSDSLSDISTIHHEEIVPDNLNKFLQEEFYKYLHEKYVQRNISKYYHANRVLKKYRKRFVKTKRQ